MAAEEAHALGYKRVDDDANLSVLVAAQDATGRWAATRSLREWERSQLQLEPGQRLLDVGCGPGDAALALAADLGDDGELVGIDLSQEMISVARSRSEATRCRVRFSVGDAVALDEPDTYFDVVRSERTLQWVDDSGSAVAEMARVLRRGGRLSLIDTDWSTFGIDVGDHQLARRVRDAMRRERSRPSNVGSRLTDLLRAAGFEVVDQTASTQTWDRWDPDESPAPDGCFSMSSLADDLIETGAISPTERDGFVSTVHQAAREGRFSMTLTMFAAVGTAPQRLPCR